VVTHLTTNPPVRCLNRAERTGSLVFNVLWSYVEEVIGIGVYVSVVSLIRWCHIGSSLTYDACDDWAVVTQSCDTNMNSREFNIADCYRVLTRVEKVEG
jgi:hypothetical protein